MKPPIRTRRRAGAPTYAPSIANAGDSATNWPLGGPEVRIEYRALAELKLPKRQLRNHDKKQVGQIGALMRRAGFINPIIIDGELTIVAGVGRYMAARDLGRL